MTDRLEQIKTRSLTEGEGITADDVDYLIRELEQARQLIKGFMLEVQEDDKRIEELRAEVERLRDMEQTYANRLLVHHHAGPTQSMTVCDVCKRVK